MLSLQMEQVVDSEFICDLVDDTYSSDNGHPSSDLTMLSKISIIQCFYEFRSMRQTIKKMEVNTAYP